MSSVTNSSNSAAPIDPASRVLRSTHDPAVEELLAIPVCWGLVDCLIDATVSTVARALVAGEREQASHYEVGYYEAQRQRFEVEQRQFKMERLLRCALFVNFAKCFVEESRIDTSTILIALVYISRLQIYVPPTGDDWLCERIFLGAIILAYRCQNDTDVKPDYWASSSSGAFDTRTICRVQREFLYWINYDISVHNDDLLAQYDIVMDRCVIDRGCWAKKTIVNITDVERPEYRCTIDPQSPPPPPHIESPPCFVPDLEYPFSPSPPSSCDSLTLITPEGYAQTSWHPMVSQSPLVHQTQLAPRSYRTRDVEQTGYTRHYTQDLISASSSPTFQPVSPPSRPRDLSYSPTPIKPEVITSDLWRPVQTAIQPWNRCWATYSMGPGFPAFNI